LPLLIGRLCDVISQKQSTDGKAYNYAKISVVVDESLGWGPSRRRLIEERCKFLNLYLQTKLYEVDTIITGDPVYYKRLTVSKATYWLS
jgi:hypothetical protein